MRQRKARTRWSEVEAERELERWRSSGETLPRYCRKRGILYERLRRWRVRLEGRKDTELRAVRIVDALPVVAPDAAPLCIDLASGHRLQVPSGTDLELLARVVSVLERA